MKKHALITGSAGFVGRHMVRTLEAHDYIVQRCDILHGLDVMRLVDRTDFRYDLVVHAAAAGPHRRAIDTQPANFSYNVMLDAAMLEWAIRTRQYRFVYLSSSAVYPTGLQTESGWRTTADRGFMGDRRLCETDTNGDPFDTYGWTKLFGERQAATAREAGVAVHIVRPFSGYGEDQSEDFPFRAFIERAKRREDPFTIWGNAQQVRDWIHIDDICAGIMAIVDADYQLPVNLCTGLGMTMASLAWKITGECGYSPKWNIDETAPMGVFYRVGDPTRFHELYRPKVSITEGIRRALGRN